MNDAQARDLDRSTVLIVDDNPENLRVLREMLADQGFEVRVARDGRQALRSVEASPPDLVLLDIHMPDVDGYEVCRQLKRDPRYQDIPVIFLSALGETFNKVTAYDCGGCDYITKPYQFEEVRVRMHAHMKTRHLLAESQAGFRSSFEQAAVGMAHMTTDGSILRVNRRFAQLLDCEEHELLGRRFEEFVCPPFRSHAERERVQAIGIEADGATCEVELLRKDGSRVWCRTTHSLVEVPSTREQYILAIVEDVSDRKRVEDERRQLEAAIEQAGEAIVIADIRGNTQYVNPAWEQVSGIPRSHTLGKNLWKLLVERSDGSVLRALWKAVTSGKTWTGRIHIEKPDGTVSTEDVTASPVRDTDGKIVSFLAVARDMTSQLALEERLQHAQKLEAIGTLAGGIAHDFNNILSAIMGYTDIAMTDLPEGCNEVRSSLLEVAKASQRARELISQILEFSRQTDREIRPVRVQSIMREALKLLRGSIPSMIEIHENIDNSCLPVLADPTGIHQILMNLGTNAYHAMRDTGGKLVMRLSQIKIGDDEVQQDPNLAPGEYVRLEVHDTGHGMTEETQTRIFEPYFTTKERGEGTGLGLATIHGIVTDLQGVIHVYSEPGEGSTFTVLLPCVLAGEATGEPPAPIGSLRGTEHVLLVDDESPIAEFAKTALERLGYRVTIETNSLKALERFTANPAEFDVVVTDQMMPGMKGIELSKRIRTVRNDIPIILCSGFAESLRDTSGDNNSVRYHVMKPVIGADLARSIRSVVDQS
ncbi:MAG: response regulator [Candidatus Hydrogenedentes bacterium]|nr:response regulator [Candidatus Hydrogenedentota bacterium]